VGLKVFFADRRWWVTRVDKIPRHRGHGLVVAQALQPQATILVIPLAEKLIERPQEHSPEALSERAVQ
jgi:hypothetical protein